MSEAFDSASAQTSVWAHSDDNREDPSPSNTTVTIAVANSHYYSDVALSQSLAITGFIAN
jgi:hypothetical protein